MDKEKLLFKSAKDLFIKKGFKDTKVPDITKKAGVGVGTFYNYFPSKEEIFIQVFLEENAKLKDQVKIDLDMDRSPIEIIKELMRRNYVGMITNPILKEWYNPEVYRKVEQVYREKYSTGMPAHKESTLEIIKIWQEEGKMRTDIDREMIYGIIYSIINVDLHKEEIGVEYFPKIMDYLFEFVMKGLE